MSGALNRRVVLKEGHSGKHSAQHSGRRLIARALLSLAAALRKAARRLDAAGAADAGSAPDIPAAVIDASQPSRARLKPDAVFWGLVRKDLYASRLIIVAAFVTAAAGSALQSMGGELAAIVLVYCAIAAPAAFLCLMLISGERQERSHLFALSLPISPARYLLAKVVSVTTAFAVPWGLLGAGIAVRLATSPQYVSSLPLTAVVWLFVLDLYCGLLWVVVASRSAGLVTAAMILFNVSPSLYFNYVARWTNPEPGAAVLWNPYALRVVTMESALAAVFFALTLWCVFRQRDQN